MSKDQVFSSVWDAIEDTPQAASSMRARSNLMMAIQEWVKTTQKTQAGAAQILGVTQPRMSDLMRGKIALFSLDSLMDMATSAGLEPQVQVRTSWAEDLIGEVAFGASEGMVQEVRSPIGDIDIEELFVVDPKTTESRGPAPRRLTLVKPARKAA